MSGQIDSKVSPQILEAITSIEISEKLSAILRRIDQQVPEGKVYSIPVAATTAGVMIVILFGATIYNDGTADVYILDSDRNIGAQDVPLKSGENLAVDFRTRGQYTHWVKTLAGTATVRIHAYK